MTDKLALVEPSLPIRSDPRSYIYCIGRGDQSRRIPRACAARNERSPVSCLSFHPVCPADRSPSPLCSPFHLHLHPPPPRSSPSSFSILRGFRLLLLRLRRRLLLLFPRLSLFFCFYACRAAASLLRIGGFWILRERRSSAESAFVGLHPGSPRGLDGSPVADAIFRSRWRGFRSIDLSRWFVWKRFVLAIDQVVEFYRV